MAAKKKSKKQHVTKSKKTSANKKMPTRKPAKKKAVEKKESAKKANPKTKMVKKKVVGKTKPGHGNVGGRISSDIEIKRSARLKDQTPNTVSSLENRHKRYGGQSGDLQGLSGVERADSESVDELLEEGNAFEADVVTGVEDADDADEREVHTHEVPEDDVPDEYSDE